MAEMKKSFRAALEENNIGFHGPPELEKKDIIVEQMIGEGAFGVVHAGKLKGMDVAIKIPHQGLSTEELSAFAEEIKVLRTIFHPNVVLFLGACTEEDKIMIVTEKMEMDVETFLERNRGKLSLLEKMEILKGAALGLMWIHGLGMIHRDLKLANLLLDKNQVCKVTDFGFTELKKKEKQEDEPKGTALYMAPEVMDGKQVTYASDIYSFGLMLWEIVTEEELFPGFEDPEKFMDAIIEKGMRPEIPKRVPPLLAQLMEQCWSAKVENRPSAGQVANTIAEIIVDEYFSEENGHRWAPESRAFWKENFLDKKKFYLEEEVPWPKFSQIVCTQLQLAAQHLGDIKDYLVHIPKGSTQEFVSMRALHQVVQWFGPFYIPEKSKKILSLVKSLHNAPWFHGEISKELAEDRLRSREPGTFLVRLSMTSPDCPFTISKVAENNNPPIAHKRVKYHPEKDKISVPMRKGGPKEYLDLLELVKDPEQGLRHPCPEDTKPFNPYSEDEE